MPNLAVAANNPAATTSTSFRPITVPDVPSSLPSLDLDRPMATSSSSMLAVNGPNPARLELVNSQRLAVLARRGELIASKSVELINKKRIHEERMMDVVEFEARRMDAYLAAADKRQHERDESEKRAADRRKSEYLQFERSMDEERQQQLERFEHAKHAASQTTDALIRAAQMHNAHAVDTNTHWQKLRRREERARARNAKQKVAEMEERLQQRAKESSDGIAAMRLAKEEQRQRARDAMESEKAARMDATLREMAERAEVAARARDKVASQRERQKKEREEMAKLMAMRQKALVESQKAHEKEELERAAQREKAQQQKITNMLTARSEKIRQGQELERQRLERQKELDRAVKKKEREREQHLLDKMSADKERVYAKLREQASLMESQRRTDQYLKDLKETVLKEAAELTP